MTRQQSQFLMCSFVLLGFSIGCSQPNANQVKIAKTATNSADDSSVTSSTKTSSTTRLDKTDVESDTPKLESTESPQIEPKNSNSKLDDTELPSLADAEQNPIDTDDDSYRTKPDPVEEKQTIEIPVTWKRLSKEQEIWIDLKNKQVIAAGNICLRAGPLEVFACPRRTKEHESVISVNALSSQIHAALLATGTEPGEPVRWHERYQAATGPVIKIDVMWKQDGKIQRIPAQKMVKDFKTDKVMTHDWVFGGSQTYEDEETGETYYYGDSGELVCLSNFSTATMDVPVQSSDANDGLLFGANTENIPDVNTKVYLLFMPQTQTQSKQKPEMKDK